ncbi:DNA replication and repair protein RecF [Robertkochia marina]|uniref:DNA replication and repair protein RecF n=1 Tax=Robertkochia marina TaxID=1227945 RepID=A0A4S3LYB5_9FLAO|nr:DNA replication and repair protein RecF [Robertkochia marina]THD66578.1 DNA replication and repair protein RecF [Robertkochia marina]TRZ45583.1 DNA replication and repair protein RecF [Robertkochia marina]
MILKQLSLINYKNFDSRNFELDEKINCFVGNNGIGKTNVLDAVYHLAFGKSYFNPVASQNIRHGEDFMVIEGLFSKEGKDERVVLSLKKGQKKVIKRNGKIYDKISDHIGFIPLVIISPADRDLIIEGSDTRRKFIDGVISQSNPAYLHQLLSYNKLLSQRNSLLKYFALNNTFDRDTLEIYDLQMDTLGAEIFEQRKYFLDTFIPIFKERYLAIAGKDEGISLNYESQLFENDLKTLFRESINKDKALQYTSKGVHKDDLKFEIMGHPVKKFGSQGQQKSFLIALKLAQFDFLKERAGVTPLLLLDDIFDKLDENRVGQIIALVNKEEFGQIFISDTHPERTEEVVKATHQTYKMIKLSEV